MTTPKTSTKVLAEALRVLAMDIQSEDGVANAAIAEAAGRLEELQAENKALREALEEIPFPAISANSADTLAFNLEQRGTFGAVSNETAAKWLRDMAKKLARLDTAKAALTAKREEGSS